MMHQELIKKVTSKILRNKRKTFFDRSIMHPEREWFLGIFVALLILGGGIFWSSKTYLQFSNVLLTYQEEEEKVIYRENMVETALSDFSARKEVYEKLKRDLIGNSIIDTIPAPAIEEVVPDATDVDSTDSVVEEEVLEEQSIIEENNTTEGLIFE